MVASTDVELTEAAVALTSVPRDVAEKLGMMLHGGKTPQGMDRVTVDSVLAVTLLFTLTEVADADENAGLAKVELRSTKLDT